MNPVFQHLILSSQHLNEDRQISIYLPHEQDLAPELPVLLCADGQTVMHFGQHLHQEMQAGRAPAVALVGMHSDPETRNYDYVLGFDQTRYEAHERFVLKEVIPSVCSTLGIQTIGGKCGVFGFSNGGVFSHSIAIRNPDVFDAAVIFSAADNRVAKADYPPECATSFYLSAGTQDRHCRKVTASIARHLKELGLNYHFTEREAGHDLTYWIKELAAAVNWICEH